MNRYSFVCRLFITLVAACSRFNAADAQQPPPPLQYTVSWVGNSFSGKDRWIQDSVSDLCVLPDGTLFTNAAWDEADADVTQFENGNIVAVARHMQGWGNSGGEAVAANSKYLFIGVHMNNEGNHLVGNSWPPVNFDWSGVSRRPRSDITKGAPFPGGHGKEGDVLPGSYLVVDQFPQNISADDKARRGDGQVRGLCATETRLYVSSPWDDAIKVYDPQTMQQLQSWPVSRPDRISLDRDGHLWVLIRPMDKEPWKAVCYDDTGKALPYSIVFENGVHPTAMSFNKDNDMLIADDGPDQQVKIYTNLRNSSSPPSLRTTFGVKGGILAGPVPGLFGPKRFDHPAGVGSDDLGNLYVVSAGSPSGGGTILEAYRPWGSLIWRLMALSFIDLGGTTAADETNLYTKDKHIHMDYAKPPGQEWSFVGVTYDPQKYPDDPRGKKPEPPAFVWERLIKGKKLLFMADMVGRALFVYRFNHATDGEIAIPYAIIAPQRLEDPTYPQPDKGEWMWQDANGNGALEQGEIQAGPGKDQNFWPVLIPDETGAIWDVVGKTIRCRPVTGVNSYGYPTWDFAKARTWPIPPEFDSVRRLQYLPKKDILILAGTKGNDHNQHWKTMGPVLAVYDHWKFSNGPKLRKSIVLPYEKGAAGIWSTEPMSFEYAGDYLFICYTHGLKAEGIENAFVRVYRWSDLSFVGDLVAEKDMGNTGLLDLVESVRAIKRSNGEYIVFLEDDYKAKIVMFRWKPQD